MYITALFFVEYGLFSVKLQPDKKHRNVSRRNSADTACLTDTMRTDGIKLLSCLKAQTDYCRIVDVARKRPAFKLFHALRILDLSGDVSVVFDHYFSLDPYGIGN